MIRSEQENIDVSRKYLLIGGTGRSGTTILCRAMGKHPDITDVPEWRFTTDPDGVVDFYTHISANYGSPFLFDRSIKRLQKVLIGVTHRDIFGAIMGSRYVRTFAKSFLHRNLSSPYGRTNAIDYSPNFEKLSEKLLDELVEFTYQGFWVGMELCEPTDISFAEFNLEAIKGACSRFLRDVAEDVCTNQGAKYHLEKNTWNILCFDKILEILPESKLIHITRDPRDVISSYSVQPWAPDDLIKSAKIYQSVMNKWWEISERIPPESYIEVRLEDLVSDPKHAFQTLIEFWGIEWSETLLKTKLSSSSFGRWKVDLPHDVQNDIHSIIEPTLKRYDYA